MATARASRSIVRRIRHPQHEREIKRVLGRVPELFRHVMPVPWVMRVGYVLGTYPTPHVPLELTTMISFVVSRDHACRYCAGLARTLLRVIGFTDARIDRLERDIHTADLDPGIAPALELARKISRLNPGPSARDFERLTRAGYSDDAIVDIVYAAAMSTFTTRIASFLDIPSEPIVDFSERALFRFLRPLLRRLITSRRPRWESRALEDDAPGPYDELLDGFRRAPALRESIRWALAQLPTARRVAPQTSAIVLAVIARALGCARTEARALTTAASLGLDRELADAWLRRLTGPEMSPLELELIPLARETARYQTHLIKPRFAAFSEAHDDETVIEVVGVCALANMLCRLEVLERAA